MPVPDENVARFMDTIENRVFRSDLEKIIWLSTAFAHLAATSPQPNITFALNQADEMIMKTIYEGIAENDGRD